MFGYLKIFKQTAEIQVCENKYEPLYKYHVLIYNIWHENHILNYHKKGYIIAYYYFFELVIFKEILFYYNGRSDGMWYFKKKITSLFRLVMLHNREVEN